MKADKPLTIACTRLPNPLVSPATIGSHWPTQGLQSFIIACVHKTVTVFSIFEDSLSLLITALS